MSEQTSKLDGPAMPQSIAATPDTNLVSYQFADGMGLTLRQYAAIHLRNPCSGDAELDAMIREARAADDVRALAAAWIGYHDHRDWSPSDIQDKLASLAIQSHREISNFGEHRQHPVSHGVQQAEVEQPSDEWHVTGPHTRTIMCAGITKKQEFWNVANDDINIAICHREPDAEKVRDALNGSQPADDTPNEHATEYASLCRVLLDHALPTDPAKLGELLRQRELDAMRQQATAQNGVTS